MKTDSILLVDDNAFALKELVNILKYIGYKNLTSLEDVSNVLDTVVSEAVVCIISALEMDDISGLKFLRMIRDDDRFITLPFYLTDSAFTKETVIKAGLAGATGLIVTPYDKENLEAKLEAISLIADDPSFIEETENLSKGITLLEEGNYEEAIDALDDVVNSDETAEYYYNIGYIKTLEEKYGEAIPAFQKATQLDSLFGKAFEGLGRAYNALGQTEEAEKYMQKAAEIYLDKDKIEEAEFILNDILAISQDSVNIFNSLGVLYRKKGEFEASMKQYKKALKVHPEEIYILYNVGRLYIDMKEPESAVEYFEKAIELEPDFKEAKEVLDAIRLGTL